MNTIVKPITPDGRTGFDEFGQLLSWSMPDAGGYKSGHMIWDVRACTCYICGRGWENTSESLRDQETEQIGKDGMRFYHQGCIFGFRKLKEAYFWTDALIEGGFLFKTEEVPPRYPHSTPWQRVYISRNDPDRTDSGFRLVVGRRKRVWELRCHGVDDLSENDYFSAVRNTKGHSSTSEEDPEFGKYFYVHAYTRAAVVEYLQEFHKELSKLALPHSISRSY